MAEYTSNNQTIKTGQKYFDNRFNDCYTIAEIISENGSAKVKLQYDRKGLKEESADFITYHISMEQHIKDIFQKEVA